MTTPTFSHGDQNYLTDAQLGQLLKGINPLRVNKDGKGMSHVEAYEIRAHLNRIFGFGRWDEVITDQRVVFESGTDEVKPRWTVCWYAHCTLTLRSPSGHVLATYGEGATGDATNFPSRADAHDMAAKTAASQALKRCAMNLGDQFGLSLYQKGSIRPLVGRTLIWDAPAEADAAADRGDVAAHITSPLAPEGAVEGGESQRESSSPPASRAPSPAPAADGGAPVSGGPAPAVDHCGAEAWPQGPLCELAPGHPGGHYPQAFAQAPAVNGSPVMGASEMGFADLPEDADLNGQGEAEPEPATDPTVPDAAGESRAVSGEPASSPTATLPSGPSDEESAAEADPTAAVSASDAMTEPAAGVGPTPAVAPTAGTSSSTEAASAADAPTSEPDDEDDPITAWETITGGLAAIRMTPPEQAIGFLNEFMELATRHGLTKRRMADSDKTLGAVLTDTMRDCRAAIERRKAAAAAGQ